MKVSSLQSLAFIAELDANKKRIDDYTFDFEIHVAIYET